MRRNAWTGGGLRRNVLWGTCVTAVVLSLPVTAGASAVSAGHAAAMVPAGMRAAAKAHPQQMFDVIVQSAGAATSADAARAVRESARSRVVKRRFGTLRAVAASITGGGLLRLAAQPGVLAVTPDSAVTTTTLRNPQAWPGGPHIDWFWGSSFAKTTRAATIAIVDSGVDTSNNEFGTRLLTQVDLTSTGPSARADGRGHGTFVAGIAAGAGKYGGAAPSANVVSLKVFNDVGQGTTSDVLRATDWILQNRTRYDIRVANFSLQTSVATSFRFDPLDRALERLWQAGVVVVAAAGNYASDGQPSGVLFSPANDPFVITVGALDDSGSPSPADDFNAPWSAYGYTLDGFAKPEVAAPGRHVIEWVPPDTSLAADRPSAVVKDGMQLSGTSFAAPVVSGIAADLLGVHPEWTPGQVKGALMRSARSLPAAAPLAAGVGEIDIQAALSDATAPPNANAALDRFLVPDPDGGPYPVFGAASWAAIARNDASWDAASWNTASWNSASWNTASWQSASWQSGAFASASWSSASWLNVLVTDGAAAETGGEG
ncbi:MAG: S8 family serine peptidase [Gaiellaceae bacterium]